MTDRIIRFVGAGEQDISEVTISTGVHPVEIADPLARVTYTVSYPSKDGVNPLNLEESFIEAARAITDDAENRGVNPGE